MAADIASGGSRRYNCQTRGAVWPSLTATTLLLATACESSSAPELDPTTVADWGPLAVAERASGDEALIGGTLSITESCVTIDDDDRELTVVWPAEATRWTGDDRTIHLVGTEGSETVFQHGEAVTLGGSVGATVGRETAVPVSWLAEPDPRCPGPPYWFVTPDP